MSKIKICYFIIFLFVICLPLQGQTLNKSSYFNKSKFCLKNIIIDQSISINIDKRINFSWSPNEEKRYKHNIIPIIVFGLVGTIAGGYIGSKFDPTTSLPGEFPELYTKGILIGMGIGALVGGTIGYILGKEEIKEKPKSMRDG